MKIIRTTQITLLALLVAFLPLALLSPKHAEATNGSFNTWFFTNDDSHSGCYDEFQVMVSGGFTPGGTLTVQFAELDDTILDNNGSPCWLRRSNGVPPEYSVSFNPNVLNDGSPLTNATVPMSPNSGNSYVLYLYGSRAYDGTDGTGYHRVSGSTGVTLFSQSTATISVSACPEGGSWSLSPGGYSASPSTVNADSAGTTYTLSYTPPSGFTDTISPSASQVAFPNGTYNFTVSCTPLGSPPVITLAGQEESPNNSCGEPIDLSWSATNANLCSSLDIPALNPSGPTNGFQTLSLPYTYPPSNAVFTIACGGPSGTSTNAINVPYGHTTPDNSCTGGGGGNPVVTVTANPGAISPGGNSTITWNATNATACSPNFGWTGSGPTSGTAIVSPSVTTTYSMTCTKSGGGSSSGSATVTVGSTGTAGIVVRSNIPTTWSINPGSYSTTTPNTFYVYLINACATYTLTPGTLSGYGEVTTVTNNNALPANYTGNSVFLCPSSTYSAQFQMTYTAIPVAPTVNFSASPTSIANGQPTTLTWSSTNATSCTASGGWSGAKATSTGSQSLNPSSTSTYTLTCTGAGGSNSKSATVTVSSGSDPTYVGCYLDDASRALPNQLMSSGATVETCKAAAQAAGFQYAGLQYFGQCFAGNVLGYSPLPESSCNTPCDANPSETCGGPWANSIYTTNAPPPPPPINSTINVTSPVSWVLNPDGDTSSPATVTPDSVNGTQYTLVLTGSCASPNITNNLGGGASVTLHGGEIVNFNVTCALPPISYSLTSLQSPQSITQGNNSTQALVKASLNSGTSQNVILNVSWPSGQPTGVSYSIVPSSGCSPAPGSDCPYTININDSGSTPPGTYPFTVSGTPAASNGSLSYNLVVTPSLSGGNTPTTAVPNPGSNGQQITWTTCTAAGGTPPYTYTWNGTDVNNLTTTTNTLLFTYTKPGLKTMNAPTITDSASTPQTVSCSSGGSVKIVLNTNYQEF